VRDTLELFTRKKSAPSKEKCTASAANFAPTKLAELVMPTPKVKLRAPFAALVFNTWVEGTAELTKKSFAEYRLEPPDEKRISRE
jgi:hypothetical protein